MSTSPQSLEALQTSVVPVGRALWRASVSGLVAIMSALLPFLWQWRPSDFTEAIFVVTTWLQQSLLIASPLFVYAAITLRLERRRRFGRWTGHAVTFGYATLATLVAAVLIADNRIHELYGFHINGFVLNLAVTPGGLGSLDASTETWITVGTIALLVFALVYGLLAWLRRRSRVEYAPARSGRRWVVGLTILGLVLVNIGLYGYADMSGNSVLLRASGLLPFYQTVTYRRAARFFGVEAAPRPIGAIPQKGILLYPLKPIEIKATELAPPNVLWLVAESLRWDLLSETTMPHLWRFAADNLRFANHFSGGNRTRMGMFTMFYGLHGPYWFRFLDARRSPVFFDVLQRRDYDIELFTSAKFSYPEFDRTIFVNVPDAQRHEYYDDKVFWHRDVHNVDAIIASLQQRDTHRPFMRFLFFEATHAPYEFPEGDAIARPFGAQLNYALMDPARDIEVIRNRYTNAAHFVDKQIGRLLDYLGNSGALPNTIVIVTGDHGEEMMEHGHWGHGSAFVDEQIRVPLVMRIPGEAARVVDAVTSHLDIVPTILPSLGVANPPSDYALGLDVVRGARDLDDRHHIIASEWSGFAYIDAAFVATIPMSGGFAADVHQRGSYDSVPALPFFQSHAEELARVMREMSLFLEKGKQATHTKASR